MQIINSKVSKSNRFKPGFNLAMGKFYGSSKDLVADMKAKGLEPYNPNAKEKVKPDYKPSRECHEKIEYIRKHTDKKGNVKLSGKLMSELAPYLPKK